VFGMIAMQPFQSIDFRVALTAAKKAAAAAKTFIHCFMFTVYIWPNDIIDL
jgi:hypothetical protein